MEASMVSVLQAMDKISKAQTNLYPQFPEVACPGAHLRLLQCPEGTII